MTRADWPVTSPMPSDGDHAPGTGRSQTRPQPLAEQGSPWALQHAGDDLEAIDLELGRLAMLCGVSLRQPRVIESILHDDETICLAGNHTAWIKLRGLLVLHYHVVAKCFEPDGYGADAR